jgi:hypothetical protein
MLSHGCVRSFLAWLSTNGDPRAKIESAPLFALTIRNANAPPCY